MNSYEYDGTYSFMWWKMGCPIQWGESQVEYNISSSAEWIYPYYRMNENYSSFVL